MKRNLLAFALAAAVLETLPARAQDNPMPSIPSNLEVPSGNTLYLKTQASGTQNYICLPSATGFAWTFLAPTATLFMQSRWNNGELGQQITTHFLSPNPQEDGQPRPTWQSSFDTSAVWAKAIASSTDAAYVAPGSIPWLLLEATGTQRGSTGGVMLAETTYLQRLNTSGGVAPSSGCTQASQVGTTALVPYTTDYYFYRASR